MGFRAQSTTAEVLRGVDLNGKLAIVTGGYSGIGLETTRALAAAGARVVVPARRPDTAKQVLDGIDGVEVDELEDCDIAEPAVDGDTTSGVRAYAVDPEQAARLWALSAELTGVDAVAAV